MVQFEKTEYSRTVQSVVPTFNGHIAKKSFENIVRKGENDGNQHFLLFL